MTRDEHRRRILGLQLATLAMTAMPDQEHSHEFDLSDTPDRDPSTRT